MFFYCWGKWREYLDMLKQMRDIIVYMLVTHDKKCFSAWKAYVLLCKQEKEGILRRFIMRMKNAELASVYLMWVHWARKRKHTKKFLRRLFICPQFELWLDYVNMEKLRRRLSSAATVIQALGRRIIHRRWYLYVRTCIKRIEHFTYMVLAMRLTRLKREEYFETGFCKWAPTETIKLHEKSTENERRRSVRQQQVVQEAEFKAVKELKKHLRTHSGLIQIAELCVDIKQGLYSTMYDSIHGDRTLSPADMLKQLATKELMRKCKHMSRCLERHEFNVRSPPFIKCADPKCAAVFTAVDQYHMHVSRSNLHLERSLLPNWFLRSLGSSDSVTNGIHGIKGNPRRASGRAASVSAPSSSDAFSRQNSAASELQINNLQLFSHVHIILRHAEGCQLLRQYIVRVHGEGVTGQPALANCFDLWQALQEIRRTSITAEATFYGRVFAVLDTYLSPGCPKPLPMNQSVNVVDEGDPTPELAVDDGAHDTVLPSMELVSSRVQSSFIRSIRGIREVSSKMMQITAAPAALAIGQNQPPSSMSDLRLNTANYARHSLRMSRKPALGHPELEITGKVDKRSEFAKSEDAAAAETVGSVIELITAVKMFHTQMDIDGRGRHNNVTNHGGNQYEIRQARHSLWRKLMRLPPESYDCWTDQNILVPDIFDSIEWFCFRRIFSSIICDLSFTRSVEYKGYLELCAADALSKQLVLRHDYAQYLKHERQKWTSHFKFIEMSISRKAEDILTLMLPRYLNSLTTDYLTEETQRIVGEQSEQEQITHEGVSVVIDEAVDWVLLNEAEEIYGNYVSMLIQQMWDRPELRKILLTFVGIVEDKHKKKIFVDMAVSSRAQKAAFTEYMGGHRSSGTDGEG
jgi:hypothetical protein